MPYMLSWSFHVERPNASFPTQALLITKAMIEYYFDVKLTQTTNGTWKIILSTRSTSTPGWYAFTNGWNTYFSSTRNYNNDAKSICAAQRHEAGHTPVAPSSVRGRHNSDTGSLMYKNLNSNVMWTPNDWNYWFKNWPIKDRGCFNPAEMQRWFPNQSFESTERIVLGCRHRNFFQLQLDRLPLISVPPNIQINEAQYEDLLKDLPK